MFTHVPSQSGDLIFVYGADITARRRNEELLAEQAAQLAEVARFPEMNPGPVLRMDTDGAGADGQRGRPQGVRRGR